LYVAGDHDAIFCYYRRWERIFGVVFITSDMNTTSQMKMHIVFILSCPLIYIAAFRRVCG